MSTNDTVTIRFATKTYSASTDGGRIIVTQNGRDVLGTTIPQGGNAMIAAISELEDLQGRLLDALLDDREMPRWGADELPLNVDIEGGKYTFRCAQAGAFHIVNAHIDRHGEYWIDTDELQYKDFWITLAGALHNARRKVALLG